MSQANQLAARLLDEHFSDIWIEGEVSNLKPYPSGHIYFTLKDRQSQIAAACFRSAAQRLKFKLTDGLLIIGHGKLGIYPTSGRYQVILDTIEPKGQGALQLAFEQLKRKLLEAGLFAEERKRPLPQLPRVVGIVTSPAGAAIHDILRTLRLHHARLKVLLYPVAVQGEGAAQQIAEGIRYLSTRPEVDVIIIGRGGGSLEDLWAFNEEIVARAMVASRVPVVSGVGHEVDFTIADFAADVRAATPTAAAQLVSQGWETVCERLADVTKRLPNALQEILFDREQRLQDHIVRIEREVTGLRYRAVSRLRTLSDRIAHSVITLLHLRRTIWQTAGAKLDTLSPFANLKRGYAICLTNDGRVVSSIAAVEQGSELNVRVADGTLDCTVRAITKENDNG